MKAIREQVAAARDGDARKIPAADWGAIWGRRMGFHQEQATLIASGLLFWRRSLASGAYF